MTAKNYALIKNGEILVENTIVAEPDYTLDGYYLIEILDGVFCQTGIYYNAADGLFYIDEEFTSTVPSSE